LAYRYQVYKLSWNIFIPYFGLLMVYTRIVLFTTKLRKNMQEFDVEITLTESFRKNILLLIENTLLITVLSSSLKICANIIKQWSLNTLELSIGHPQSNGRWTLSQNHPSGMLMTSISDRSRWCRKQSLSYIDFFTIPAFT